MQKKEARVGVSAYSFGLTAEQGRRLTEEGTNETNELGEEGDHIGNNESESKDDWVRGR
jgi:hypothetical protein